ncbi:MAG TPA: hypothetical protein V6D05_05545 [Stenomitos sp.]
MDFRRLQAQRQAELDEALLREIGAERARLNGKLKTLLNEIEGIRKILVEYQARITDLEPAVADLRALVGELERQEHELLADHARWLEKLAG